MADSNLVDYIKGGMKKGYSETELKKILKENGWTDPEISEAFLEIKGSGPSIKPTQKPSSPKEQALLNFIKKALSKGYPEDKIRQALLSKRWPLAKINKALAEAKPPVQKQEKKIEPKPLEKPKEVVKTHTKISAKKILLYALWFIIISAVLTVSIGVYYYIQGLSSYTVTDPNTGQLVTGYCLNEDCSDMRDYIFDSIMDSLWLILTISIAISLLIVLLHAFIPQKEWVIWIADILFFLYIIYILVLWFLSR